jgi:glucose-6-phosphate dehydrogenase assembly protein OpcA
MDASMTELSPEDVRRLVGTQLTDMEASGLAEWYAALAAALDRFPRQDLKTVEPPLRSTPGPARP